jgi:hypothetical protein
MVPERWKYQAHLLKTESALGLPRDHASGHGEAGEAARQPRVLLHPCLGHRAEPRVVIRSEIDDGAHAGGTEPEIRTRDPTRPARGSSIPTARAPVPGTTTGVDLLR